MIKIFRVTHIIFALVRVAFYTLLERKILRYIQNRKGPNKVRFMGILQPFADAIKLLSNENPHSSENNKILYTLMPSLTIVVSIAFWSIALEVRGISVIAVRVILFLTLRRVSIYPIIGTSWFSRRKFAIIGASRALAQVISYEVRIIIILFIPLFFLESLRFIKIFESRQISIIFFLVPIVRAIWIICTLAETNRAPFDFAEGESELVSGFNVEFGSSLFTFLFLREYSIILFIRLVSRILFCRINLIMLGVITLLFSINFLFFRGSFPRFRYDHLISISWARLIIINLAILIVSLAF